MAPAFRSSVACQNLKILKNHYHCVKLQQKWLHKNAIQKKLFSKCYTLGCNICIKSEKITFGHIMKFLKNFFFIVPPFLKNSFIFLINPRNKKLLAIFLASKCVYLELFTGKIKKSEGIFSEHTSCQFLYFNGSSLQVEWGTLKPQNFEKSLSSRETTAKMA